MFIIDAIPLTNIPLPAPQVLTYFSPQKLKKGALISVPLSGRKVKSIVFDCNNVRQRKMEIKTGDFTPKKISKILCPTPLITPTQFKLAQWMHRFYLSSQGPILKLFLPSSILERKKLIKISNLKSQISKIQIKSQKHQLLWGENRLDFYSKGIKKALQEGKQVLFLVPRIQDLNNPVKNRPYSILHSKLKSSEKIKEWKRIRSGDSNIVYGTRSAVFAPFRNLGLIIVDRESNSAYKSWQQHPRYNAKRIALKLSKITGADLILGADLPSVTSYYKAQTGQYLLNKSKFKPPNPKISIIDLKQKNKEEDYSIFSKDLKKGLKENLEQNQNSVLFCNRRGMATFVFCQDCGWAARCENCGVSMNCHRNSKGGENGDSFLLCHHCGQKKQVPRICPECQGHRLRDSGIGIQKVVNSLEQEFPKLKVFRLDSDITPKVKEQNLTFKKFLETPGAVLVGTQLVLKFLESNPEPVNLIGIVSGEQLLNFPEFKAKERTLRILQKLSHSTKELMLQTYNPRAEVFQWFKKGNIEQFFEKEIQSRKRFSYPPFSEIVKLTYSHRNLNQVKKESQNLRRRLEKLFKVQGLSSKVSILGPIPAFPEKIKGKYRRNIVLKIKNAKIKNILLNDFPKEWKPDVNPITL